MSLVVFFSWYGDHRDLHVLTPLPLHDALPISFREGLDGQRRDRPARRGDSETATGCTPRIVLRSWFASRCAAFSALAGPVLANPVLASPVLAGPALARLRRAIPVRRRTPALVPGDRAGAAGRARQWRLHPPPPPPGPPS